MPDFLRTVFTSKNLYNFNVLKLIQRPIATFLYFILLRTHRQSLGTFSGPGNLWKIILCPGSCERCVAVCRGLVMVLGLGRPTGTGSYCELHGKQRKK